MNYKQKIGQFGEETAEKYLIKNGYEIIAKNLKTGYQEIDIVAKIKEKIIIVEVKTVLSQRIGSAEENLNRKKIQNLKKALILFTDKNGLNPDNARIDFIAVTINRPKKIANIKHFKDIY